MDTEEKKEEKNMKYEIEAKPYGSYDVVVCGGGTAGCMAAIASARQGAKTLLIERSFTVGGMLTVGEAGITKFTEHCKDVDKYKKEVLDVLATEPKKVQVVGGIAHEYVKRMIDGGAALATHGEAGSYVFTDKAEAQWTLIQMLDEAGVTVLYDTRAVLVKKGGDKVTGVVVTNKEGFCEIDAKVVIDATGDGDVCALAGASFNLGATEQEVKDGFGRYVGDTQSFGTMYRVNGVDFERLFDYFEQFPQNFVVHQFGVMSFDDVKESYRSGQMCVFRIHDLNYCFDNAWDNIQIYNLPEKGGAIILGRDCGYTDKTEHSGLNAGALSRGQYSLQKGARVLTDALKKYVPGFENVQITYVPEVGVRESRHIIGEYMLSASDVMTGKDFPDSIACGGHPLDISPLPPDIHPEKFNFNHWRFHIPYRIMLPKGVDGLLVTGRCVSASRGASGAIRPTAQCMAMGEAAGVAAAMAVKGSVTPKNIDIAELRRILTENGGII